MIQQFLTQLQTRDPTLYQTLSQNPQAFLALLSGGDPNAPPGGEGGEGGSDPPGTIRVTPEEKAAIERIEAMGFPRHRAIEAYLACDKNEEWAVNYLFENQANDQQWEEQVAQDESMAPQQPGAPGAGAGAGAGAGPAQP